MSEKKKVLIVGEPKLSLTELLRNPELLSPHGESADDTVQSEGEPKMVNRSPEEFDRIARALGDDPSEYEEESAKPTFSEGFMAGWILAGGDPDLRCAACGNLITPATSGVDAVAGEREGSKELAAHLVVIRDRMQDGHSMPTNAPFWLQQAVERLRAPAGESVALEKMTKARDALKKLEPGHGLIRDALDALTDVLASLET